LNFLKSVSSSAVGASFIIESGFSIRYNKMSLGVSCWIFHQI
jgi:hypothetical protein